MSYNQFTEPGKTRLLGRPVTYFAELLKTAEAECLGDYQHKYWGSYAGITRNQYEKGIAYYIGCFTEKETLKELYLRAAKDAGVERVAACWPVTVRSGINTDGRTLHCVLHYSEEEREWECPWEDVTDILTKTSYKKGDKILLSDWDVKILT